MELDPLYADVIVQRWENFTGRKAEREPVAAQPRESLPKVQDQLLDASFGFRSAAVVQIRRLQWSRLVPYGVPCARQARMLSDDLEGHAPSWPSVQVLTDATERVPPFGCGRRPR